MNAKRRIVGKVWMLALVPGLLAVAGPAEAGDRTRAGHHVSVGHGVHAGYSIRIGHSVKRRVWTTGHSRRVWVAPVYTIRRRVVEVPAVYETRERRVWHEPVYEYRRVASGHHHGGIGFFAGRGSHGGGFRVDVSLGGRGEYRMENVLIRAGYWETVYEEVLVRRATARVISERVLVRAGYWRHGYDGRVIAVQGGYTRSHRVQHGFQGLNHGGRVRGHRR